jgi:hypothetical protein
MDLVQLCESQSSLNRAGFASKALERMTTSDLSRAYCDNTLTPVDVARVIAERASEYLRQNPCVGTILVEPDELLREAETLQRKFAGKRYPPLYGIPFTIQRLGDYAEIDALVNAGATLLGSFIESSTYVAVLSVSFAQACLISTRLVRPQVSVSLTLPPSIADLRPTGSLSQQQSWHNPVRKHARFGWPSSSMLITRKICVRLAKKQ